MARGLVNYDLWVFDQLLPGGVFFLFWDFRNEQTAAWVAFLLTMLSTCIYVALLTAAAAIIVAVMIW